MIVVDQKLVRGAFLTLLVTLCVSSSPRCMAANAVGQAAVRQTTDTRSGGALEASFQYHRTPGRYQQPSAPHQYGFPVNAYRWGSFGAQHVYPRLLLHRGYNNNQVNWGYRRGW